MSHVRTAVLFGAMLCAGILAGFFLTYAHTIMPGLGATDDRTFVGAYQEIERAVSEGSEGPGGFNWIVAVTYFGGTLLTAVAIVLNRSRPMVWWIVAALVLLLTSIVSTSIFNVPLNSDIIDAGAPDTIDVAEVRADFRESRWRAWNIVRSVTSTAAFACLAWALFLRGRMTSRTTTPADRELVGSRDAQ